ncbi:DUF1275 family protein [Martelella endophytica]|uniref:DUF1275 family protein n=1 Tax=Martelella endophytica TaxID=1486262 RepID=UPI0009E375E5
MSRAALASILSFNGGYVDTMGFIALGGLFTAHVTGNFVTLGATIATGTGGVVAKLLALPVFCLTVMVVRRAGRWLQLSRYPVIPVFLVLQLVLFVIAAALAFDLPAHYSGSIGEILLGMVLVVAMAIQNALHRVHMTDLPPTTLLTGTTTQIMIDLSDLLWGGEASARAVLPKLAPLMRALLCFAIGCVGAALAYHFLHRFCFLFPPLLMVAALLTGHEGEGIPNSSLNRSLHMIPSGPKPDHLTGERQQSAGKVERDERNASADDILDETLRESFPASDPPASGRFE